MRFLERIRQMIVPRDPPALAIAEAARAEAHEQLERARVEEEERRRVALARLEAAALHARRIANETPPHGARHISVPDL